MSPSFNTEGKRGLFCRQHKKDGMVDVKHERCEHMECMKRAFFGTEGGKGRFCVQHKEKDMVDVKHKRCEHEKCMKRTVFDIEGGKGRFCGEHKTDGMVDVRSKRCEHDGCTKLNPGYNIVGEKGRFCVKHKKDGMVDVKHEQCEHMECTKRAFYGTEGEKGRFCVQHKKNDMVDVKHKTCEHDECMKRAVFDIEGGKGRFCGEHKKIGMVDVKNKRCLTCHVGASNKAYKGYCYRCFIHTFPDNNIVRNHKTKERCVADFVRAHFPEYDLSFDTRIEGGCSRRRPDIYIDMGSHVVIIEIDENQHDTYENSCENKRLMEMFIDAGNRPVIMIRFNPDGYKTYDKRVSSCWGTTTDRGLCKVKESKHGEWLHRLNVLKKTVKSACMDDIRKEVNVVHLFYDEV